MLWRNSADRYGLVSIGLHWLMALLVFGMFAFGLWITDLDYYDPWYHKGPWIHKSVGLIVLALLVVRSLWMLLGTKPQPLGTHLPWEKKLAAVVHLAIYLLLYAIITSGYLTSTADGRGVDLFNFATLPAILPAHKGREEIAGLVHLVLACSLMGLVALHAAGALKHHFLDKDATLRRIFGLKLNENEKKEK